jgi:hypothetical protein
VSALPCPGIALVVVIAAIFGWSKINWPFLVFLSVGTG